MCSFKEHVVGIGLIVLMIGGVATLLGTPLNVKANLPLPFIDQKIPKKSYRALLLFAGFPGCSDICPTTLQAFDHIYREIGEDNLLVVFVNILLGLSEEESMAYAKSFNPHFRGFNVSENSRKALYSKLGLYSSYSRDEVNNHTGNVFLFRRNGNDWTLHGIYPDASDLRALKIQITNLITG